MTDAKTETITGEKALLVVSFGTSYHRGCDCAIMAIENALGEAYPDYPIRRAFSSQRIIDKLARCDQVKVDSVSEAMNRLTANQVKEVIVQPTTVMNGYEYEKIVRDVMPFANRLTRLCIGKNLLHDQADYDAVAAVIVQEMASLRADKTAIVLMGHGTTHAANAVYATLQATLTHNGYTDYLIGTVEGQPALADIRAQLRAIGAKKVILRPLMIVAGDHARNDMAGDAEDAWKTVLIRDGYAVETIVEGLGTLKGIQAIYIRHVADARRQPI